MIGFFSALSQLRPNDFNTFLQFFSSNGGFASKSLSVTLMLWLDQLDIVNIFMDQILDKKIVVNEALAMTSSNSLVVFAD